MISRSALHSLLNCRLVSSPVTGALWFPLGDPNLAFKWRSSNTPWLFSFTLLDSKTLVSNWNSSQLRFAFLNNQERFLPHLFLCKWVGNPGFVQPYFTILWLNYFLLRSDFPVKGHPYTFAMPAIFRWSDFLKTSGGWRFTKATTEGKYYVQVSVKKKV